MSCAMCENHINDVVRRMRDIDRVKSSRQKNETVVIADTLDTAVTKKPVAIAVTGFSYGAAGRIRTADLILAK